jgi:hypothetical protein
MRINIKKKKNWQFMAKSLSVVVAILFTAFMTLPAMPINALQPATEIVTEIESPISATQEAQSPVDLGIASDFAILAQTGITRAGATLIVGNIGVSPIASTAMTGFSETLVGTYATSIYVVGKMYAANYDVPTPSMMTTAIANKNTAYVDAAGRTSVDQVNDLNAGSIGGLSFYPGLYKWTSGVLITTSITLSGNSSDIFIFQVAGTLSLSASAQIILQGGVQAKHIFWQVAGITTLGASSTFNGNILCASDIILNNGASLNGRALSATQVTLDTNTVTIPAPSVSSTIPVNLATGVTLNSAMSAIFSDFMDPSTIDDTTFIVKQGITIIPGIVTYTGVTAVFTPSATLTPFTTYNATITTGVKDTAGTPLAKNYTWSFTTGAAPDITPPTVNSTIPIHNASDVAFNSKVSAIFSEAMNPLTINTTTFIVMQGTTAITGTVSYSVFTALFTPTSNFTASTTYNVTITNKVKDLAGNFMVSNFTWNFSTGVAPDTTKPTVISTIPANLATNVAINGVITATFSEAMNPLNITTLTFTLKKVGAPLVTEGSVVCVNATATFTPLNNLEYSTTYTLTITTGVTDLAGNTLAVDKVWTFSTIAAPVIDEPIDEPDTPTPDDSPDGFKIDGYPIFTSWMILLGTIGVIALLKKRRT